MKTLRIFLLGLGVIIIPGMFIMATSIKTTTPTETFEYFWKTFDTHYGLFGAKHIDWNDVYKRFKPKVNDTLSDEQLYKVFCDMIVELNDNHVTLYPTNGKLPVFPGGVLRYVDRNLTIQKAQHDYDLDVVQKYTTEYKALTGSIRYGKLPGDIGYINFGSQADSRKDVEKAMTQIVRELQHTKAVIIDVRGDYGGHDAIAQYMASFFANERKLYMTTKKKNGPSHANFDYAVEWYVEPNRAAVYNKPAVVLTSRFTQSAGETFTLAMHELNHITVVGDTTAGSYSDNPTFELPNGWMFSLSIGDYRASDGKSYEGIGTAPDIFARTSKEELLSGKDSALEKALSILK